MKLPLLSIVTTLALVVGLFSSSALHANSVFVADGTNLDINGETYTWDSATEDSTWRDEVFMGPSGTVVVRGKVGLADLATVAWEGDINTFGYISNGTYGDNYSETGDGYSSYESTSYWVDFDNHELTWEYTYWDNDWMGSESSEWENSNGDFESWQRSSYTDGMGNWNWSESGDGSATGPWSKLGGSAYSQSGSDITLFGIYHVWQSGESSWETRINGTSFGSGADYYESEGGSLSVAYEYDEQAGTSLTTVSGADPYIGYFTGTLGGAPGSPSGATWAPRTGPSFVGSHLWVDGWLLSWQGGALGSDGTVVDDYSNDYLSVSISGNVRDYKTNGLAAAVTVEGDSVGTVAFAGSSSPPVWTVTGWTVSAAAGFNESDTPHFIPEASTLWVNSVPYAFVGSYTDGAGSYLDLYSNGTDGTLRLNGPDATSVTVKGNAGEVFFQGNLSSGQFTIGGSTTVSQSAPAPGFEPGPIWVRGVYYGQQVFDGETATNTFTDYFTTIQEEGSDPVDVPTHVVTFAEVSPGQWQITGTYPDGEETTPIAGTLTGTPTGVFFLGELPAIFVGDDGLFDREGDINMDPDMPKAVILREEEEETLIMKYLGQTPDAANPLRSVAWYAQNEPSICKKVLRVVSGAVVGTKATVWLEDYDSATVRTGAYDPQTYLLSTSPSTASLPHPMYAADPNLSHKRELLPEWEQVGDLPPSFVVRGQAWWFAGYDNVDGADTATYRGFYDGQVMTLGKREGDDAERLVTLVDEANNGSNVATQGTLSTVRKSVRLRDGTVVLFGGLSGGAESILVDEVLRLQTIDADLDILGNSLSFGILHNNANLAGATWWFDDEPPTPAHPDSIATLHNIVGRSNAEWVWWKAGPEQDAHALRRIMKLDSESRLHLYTPGSTGTTPPGITLDPAGASSFQGAVRILPAGDIGMGSFHQGYRPDGTFDTGNP